MIGPPSPVMGPPSAPLGRLATRKSPGARPAFFRVRTLRTGGWSLGAETNFQAPFVVKIPGAGCAADRALAPAAMIRLTPTRAAAAAAVEARRENRWGRSDGEWLGLRE